MSRKPKRLNGFNRFSIASVKSSGLVEDVKIVVKVIIKIKRIKIYAD